MLGQEICGKPSYPRCQANDYCDLNMSRCRPCAKICEVERGTLIECCNNCPETAKEHDFQCPIRKKTAPPPVSTAKPSDSFKKTTPVTKRPRNKSRSRKGKSRKKQPKKPRQQPVQKTTSSTTRLVVDTHRPSQLGLTTVLPATSTLFSDISGHPQMTTKVSPTMAGLLQVAEGSGYNLVPLYWLLGVTLAVVCLIGVCLLVLILCRNKRRSRNQRLDDQENHPQASNDCLLQGPQPLMSPVLCVNLEDGSGRYTNSSRPVACADNHFWNIQVHGQKVIQPYRANCVEGFGRSPIPGEQYEGMLANCGEQALSPGKEC